MNQAAAPASPDPDLALVVDRWESLPEALRTGIVAMVEAAWRDGRNSD